MSTTKAAHTPGPWHADKSGAGWEVRPNRNVHAVTILGHEDEANARLIAAAPEMLEALTQLSKWCDDNLNGCPAELGRIQDLAEAAIQKARGL